MREGPQHEGGATVRERGHSMREGPQYEGGATASLPYVPVSCLSCDQHHTQSNGHYCHLH